MADTVKSSTELKWDFGFADGDTRAASLKNPRSSLTLADFNTVMSAHGSVFVGDKTGAAYAGFSNARIVDVTTRQLDLS